MSANDQSRMHAAAQASSAAHPVPDRQGANFYTTDTELQSLLKLPLSARARSANACSNWATSASRNGACRVGPPSSSTVCGAGNAASAGNAARARSNQASSTGFRLPSVASTLLPSKPSCRGAMTRSQ